MDSFGTWENGVLQGVTVRCFWPTEKEVSCRTGELERDGSWWCVCPPIRELLAFWVGVFSPLSGIHVPVERMLVLMNGTKVMAKQIARTARRQNRTARGAV